MIVLFTEAAEVDLEAIGDWIAQDNPKRALTFVSELRQRCEALALAPLGFPLVMGHAQTGIRVRSYRSYLIFYRPVAETIEVLHVLHSARDYDAIVFPDE